MIAIDGVMFDLDGTLWDARQILATAWTEVLHAHGINEQLTVEKMSPLFGNELSYVIRHSVSDDVSSADINAVIPELTRVQAQCVYDTLPALYPGIQETFAVLSKHIPLMIVSNSVVGYIEAFLHGSKTGDYVTDYVCNGDTNLTKDKNILLMKNRHHLCNPLYVGDTQMDGNASRSAGVKFAFASYGFGYTEDFDYRIYELRDLIAIVENQR